MSTPDPRENGAAFRLAIGRVARRMRRVFADSGEGTAFLELAVLDRLTRSGPASPSALSGGEGVTSAAIAAALRSLEHGGLVARTRDESDGRRVVVAITGAGSDELARRDAAVMKRLDRVLQEELDEDELSALPRLIALLEKVAQKL